MSKMIEIIVNGQSVAIVVEDLAKLFVVALVQQLPEEMNISTRIYSVEQPENTEE